jgi:multidrug efflux pump
LYGLSTRDVGNTVRSAINGVTASTFRDGNDEYDITVRLSEESRGDLSSLTNLTVLTEAGQQIPISEVVTFRSQEGFGGISRKDQQRVITVSADVSPLFNSNMVLGEVQAELAEYLSAIPGGYTFSWTGEQEEQQDAIAFLSNAFLIAILLIAFILISQFNSVVKPVIVLTSVMMSVSGVLYGLVFFQMPFVIIMTGIGIISLAGVVVNNAIVLIDYIDILRQRDGLSIQEALITGGMTRFRPVILTAITTTLGLVPLAIGFNIDFLTLVSNPVAFFTDIGNYFYWGGEQAAWWSPMAVAVIVGLIFSTALTLILVPVLYLGIERLRNRASVFFFQPSPQAAAAASNGLAHAHHTNGNGAASYGSPESNGLNGRREEKEQTVLEN